MELCEYHVRWSIVACFCFFQCWWKTSNTLDILSMVILESNSRFNIGRCHWCWSLWSKCLLFLTAHWFSSENYQRLDPMHDEHEVMRFVAIIRNETKSSFISSSYSRTSHLYINQSSYRTVLSIISNLRLLPVYWWVLNNVFVSILFRFQFRCFLRFKIYSCSLFKRKLFQWWKLFDRSHPESFAMYLSIG